MGFQKWILKHGPGSPGSTAKHFAQLYQRMKSSEPTATWEDIFSLMYFDRVVVNHQLDPGNKAKSLFSMKSGREVADYSEGDLCIFTFIILYLETNQFRTAIQEAINRNTKLNLKAYTLEVKEFDLSLEVIQEVTRSILPEMIKFTKAECKKKVLQFMIDQ